MKQIYEAWADGESVTLAKADGIKWHKDHDLIAHDAQLLHTIEVDTPEEASAVHHIKMGWDPYRPIGEPQICPRRCGSYFYQEGSGICPRCGEIS